MITLALIGIGHWGNNLLKTVEGMEGCEIKYLVAKTNSSIDKFSNKYIKTTNYKDLLNYSDIDGVIIATPGSTHYEIIKDLLKLSCPLFVEKPFTTSLKETEELHLLLEGKKTKIMVGHIYLYNPAYKATKELIQSIGQIRYLSFKGYNYGRFLDNSSVLWEWAPHGVSMILDIMKKLPIEVSCWGINALRPDNHFYDNIFIKLKYENTECVIESGWLYPFKRRELIVYGSKSTLLFDDLANKKITLFEGLGPDVENSNIIEKTPKISFPLYNLTSPLEEEVGKFINLIKAEVEHHSNIEEALSVARIIDAAEKSLKNNGEGIKLV